MLTITPIQKPVFEIEIPMCGRLKCGICRKITYQKLRIAISGHEDIRDLINEIVIGKTPNMLKTVQRIFAKKYVEAVENYIYENMDTLKIPECISENSDEICKLTVATFWDKLAADYSGLNFAEINELDYIDYRLIVADAQKLKIFRQREDAIDYLNKCWMYMHDEFIIENVKGGFIEK